MSAHCDWRGVAALPFEPFASGRARPPHPEVQRLVTDRLHRAAAVVSVRRIVVTDAVVEWDGRVASLPSGLVVANRGPSCPARTRPGARRIDRGV